MATIRYLDPVGRANFAIGDGVRLRPPAEWGYPSLADPAAVSAGGMKFGALVPHLAGRQVVVEWLPFLSELAARAVVGTVTGWYDGLPVCEFDLVPGDPLQKWMVVAHPSWVETFPADPLGPPCRCPNLLTVGCTCGRAARERAAKE